MTPQSPLNDHDREQLAQLGIPTAEIERQLDILRSPPLAAHLDRPCRIGDGVQRLSDRRQSRCAELWSDLVQQRRVAKFVPASGAATRMFRSLMTEESSLARVSGGAADAFDQLCESIRNFAFYPQLETAIGQAGLSPERLIEDRDRLQLLPILLHRNGLGLLNRPKGLIPFHMYADGPRTAAAEHLWEGAGHLASPGGTSRLHFTVSEDSLERFRTHLEGLLEPIGAQLDTRFELRFSSQSPATDSVAVDPEDNLVRNRDDSLMLRPAGHGALLQNFQQVDADVVFIKNIDNVSHRRLHAEVVRWKRILGGFFLDLQTRIFSVLEQLENADDPSAALKLAERLTASHLAIRLPSAGQPTDLESRRSFWIELLDRPLRVCGVVENRSEPGGGPFWLTDPQRGSRGQIVESAQIDRSDSSQVDIWQSSTHFNPVDLVCGLSDRRGRPYSLVDFLDPATTIVARKSHAGRPIRVIERPGLWNGAMAFWNTAFVEVPLTTFTPVKTIFDLLRPEHQP